MLYLAVKTFKLFVLTSSTELIDENLITLYNVTNRSSALQISYIVYFEVVKVMFTRTMERLHLSC